MNHQDHVALLKKGISQPGGVWADFGSGDGAFTLALAELVGPTAEIYSIDKKKSSLRRQESAMRSHFPQHKIHFLPADFTKPLDLPPLDGLIMANSLHFHKQKDPLLKQIIGYLKDGGRLILVEYDVDRGNMWVPHPLSFTTWQKTAARNGLQDTQLLETRPSRFLRRIYAALSYKIGPI